MPVLGASEAWDAERWDEVGRALIKVRREEEDVVILGAGSVKPTNVRLVFLFPLLLPLLAS